tara:strand:+ start:140 stop:568 length:429 start_codon:yes stop_codon:yes gene_type:complete
MDQTHETFVERDKIKSASDKHFGLLFFFVFFLIGAWPWLFGDNGPRIWAVAAAFALLTITLLKPSLLGPANILWMRFGRILHSIVNPIIMGLIFFLTVTPTGLIIRLLRKDILKLRWDSEAKTYWMARNPPGPSGDSMSNQF